MKTREINFINMTDTVIAGFEAGQDAWSGKIPVENVLANIKAYRNEIKELAFDQAEAQTEGATQTFKNALKNMTDMSFNVILKLRPYAVTNNHPELITDIDFSKSELEQCKQMESLNRCKIILQRGLDNYEKMNGYELTREQLDELEAAINGVVLLLGNRDAIIGVRKTATEAIPVLIDKLRKELEIMDDLAPALIKDAKFVNTYNNNRRIIDR